jgi:hypothetical protein
LACSLEPAFRFWWAGTAHPALAAQLADWRAGIIVTVRCGANGNSKAINSFLAAAGLNGGR